MESKPIKMRDIVRRTILLATQAQKMGDRTLQAKLGMTLSQSRVLTAIRFHPVEPSQRRIAEFLRIEEASVSRQIKLLIKKGLIEKKASTSKREHSMILTQAGKAMTKKMLATMDGVNERIFGSINQAERRKLLILLDDMIEKMNDENTK